MAETSNVEYNEIFNRNIERLKKIKLDAPNLNKAAVELAWKQQFDQLGLNQIPVHWFENFRSGAEYVNQDDDPNLPPIPEQKAKTSEIDWKFIELYEAGLGFFWVLEREIVCIPAPIIRVDDRDRLHCATGPAISMPGEDYFYWHSVKITEDILYKRASIETIMNDQNVEIKRVAAEIYGWDEVMKVLKTEVVQQDDFGVLYEGVLNGLKARWVRVTCPTTARKYFLSVPSTIVSAREGVAATFHKKADEYHPDSET